MALLPDIGTCSYNGVSMLAGSRTRVTARPQRDQANVTVVCVEHTIEIDGWVVGGTGTIDSSMTSIKALLSRDGGALRYLLKGYGPLAVNSPADGPVKDARWGPKVELLEFIPLGQDALRVGGTAAKIHWVCRTWIPECPIRAKYDKYLMAFNYELSFDIDQDGYTTLTTRGYLEIPMTRPTVSSTLIPDRADKYRERIRPDIPPGFQRIRQEFTESKDKRQLEFVFVDQELPAALPMDVTTIDASVTIESPLPFVLWLVTVDATITLQAGTPKSAAWSRFLVLLNHVMGQSFAGGPIQGRQQGARIPQRIRISDKPFGRTSSFSAIVAFNDCTLQQIFAATGLWRAIPGADFQLWAQSVKPFAAHERGNAKLAPQAPEDAIIDLCDSKNIPQKPKIPGTTGSTWSTSRGDPGGGDNPPRGSTWNGGRPGGPPSTPGDGGGDFGGGGSPGTGFTGFRPGTTGGGSIEPGVFDPGYFGGPINSSLKPENSWLLYDCALRWIEDQNLAIHKRLPTGTIVDPKQLPGAYDGTIANGASARTTANAPGNSARNLPSDVTQRAASPSRIIQLIGFAVRIGFRIAAPQLLTVGGVTVIEMSRDVQESKPATMGGEPVYRLDWIITYLVPDAPQGPLPIMPNPTRD